MVIKRAKITYFGTEEGTWYAKHYPLEAWTGENDPTPCIVINVVDSDKSGHGVEITIPITELKKALKGL